MTALTTSTLGVTSCPPSRTPYTRDLTIFYISTLSMLFDVCDQSCWQSCVTPVETAKSAKSGAAAPAKQPANTGAKKPRASGLRKR